MGGARDFASRCARCSVNSIIERSIFHETLEVQFTLSLDRSSEAHASPREYSNGQSNNHVAGHQARCGQSVLMTAVYVLASLVLIN